jgi:hypothetical protein
LGPADDIPQTFRRLPDPAASKAPDETAALGILFPC